MKLKKWIMAFIAPLALCANAYDLTLIELDDDYSSYTPFDLSPDGNHIVGRHEHWTWTGLWNKGDFIMNWRESTSETYSNGRDVTYDNHWFSHVNNYGVACGRVDSEATGENGMGIGVPTHDSEGNAYAKGYVYTTNGYVYCINDLNTVGMTMYDWDNNANKAALWFEGNEIPLPNPSLLDDISSDYEVVPMWISDDNSMVIGYVCHQGNNKIPLMWKRSGEEYTVEPIATDYIEAKLQTEEGLEPSTPYVSMLITDISASGDWICGQVITSDWRYLPMRYNISSNTMDVLQEEPNYYPESIANDGTAIANYENRIWQAGQSNTIQLEEIYPEISSDEYGIKAISADAKTILGGKGYAMFVLTNCDLTAGITGVTMDSQTVIKGIYTLSGIKLDSISTPGLYIIDGKKQMIK